MSRKCVNVRWIYSNDSRLHSLNPFCSSVHVHGRFEYLQPVA